ncbi:cysteine desulfurase CsdA [Thermoplasmatales archaeon SW_10_69_26]|nr:MAG: cysteine desulfurase CsdA [Thermoplasmatales archaeon SW_10_69_26]
MSGSGSVVEPPPPGSSPLDVDEIRAEFPALDQQVHGRDLVYLDNAATAHKPNRVIDAVREHDRATNANVHRGVHALSQRATDAFEEARDTTRAFLGAEDPEEIIWTRGTTEAINLVADAWARRELGPDDEIVLTELEHHSNIVPWQRVREETGARLRVVPIDDDGAVEMDALEDAVGPDTALVTLAHVSNALGTVNDVHAATEIAHDADALALVDGAQAVPHMDVDVQDIGCDFYAFSGHKVYGPTGIGALYGRRELLEEMQPYQAGGEMIRQVTFEETTYACLPAKFEAGTPNITGAVGLGHALDFVTDHGRDSIRAHEDRVLSAATERLAAIDEVEILGTAEDKASVLSFVIEDVHPHDVGTVLDREGVAIRAGHHCTQPVMDKFGVAATCRASFAMYNTVEETEALADAVREAIEIFH